MAGCWTGSQCQKRKGKIIKCWSWNSSVYKGLKGPLIGKKYMVKTKNTYILQKSKAIKKLKDYE